MAQAQNLSRQQRQLLEGLITAVDAGRVEPIADDRWLLHVLRASDGAHYVAVSLSPDSTLPEGPIVLYVRLATADPAPAAVERSVLREWLSGARVDPRLLPQRRRVAIGDMPAMGAGAVGARGASSVGSSDLQAMDLERRRSRQRRDEEEKQRRAALEGTGAGVTDRLPFEDFDIGAVARLPDGGRAIERALTAGPGFYDLFIAWVDASQPAANAHYHVARRSLQLAPAAPEFGLSTIVLADAVTTLTTPFDAIAQRAHPYALGATEIRPARDTRLTPAENIAVAFQVINPAPGPSGTPDVRITPRIVRMNGAREEPVAALSALAYDQTTLPADFDIRLGHPLIAALAAPLATIPRGTYRLVITAEDRIASTVAAATVPFTVVGTPESLLNEAPPLGTRFLAKEAIEQPALDEVLTRLGSAPSPALARAVAAARAGRFADLLVTDAVAESEQGARAMLTGLALLSLGNPSAIADLQRAELARAPAAPTQFLLGSARALTGRDTEAVAAWEAARHAGMPAVVTNRLIAGAHLRRRDYPAAAAALPTRPADPDGIRVFAATRIATGQPREAVSALDELLTEHPQHRGDDAARWLLVHALYAQFVAGDRSVTERVRTEARRYVDAKGAHAPLAAEWLRVVAP